MLGAVALLLMLSISSPARMAENTDSGPEAASTPQPPPETTVSTPSDGKEVTPPPDDKQAPIIFTSKRGYISQAGCPTIVGEVKNVSSSSNRDILITASFYCSKGKEIGAEENMAAISGYTEIEILAPGEVSPFKVGLSLKELATLPNFDVDKIERYKVEVTSYTATDEQLYTGFEIAQDKGEYIKSKGHYTTAGSIRNTGNETVNEIKVIGTFYDKGDKIIEVASTYLEEPLSPGDAAQFKITLTDKNIAERIKTYHMQAVEHEGNS